ncbi:chitinase 1 [Nannizzia gypsea CBS 118893]|uniref:chitinase n=1 Tax=Arthroderma gypseum (strain ATCC MYA-4604 / CBS 118893) TaxID=535722 RepID=E4UY43_ARTGP|nr:chitinase 1 [Nannizzia gypsea CBS 118893]EFR02823.1 chitinase 1 [Nannizzia gypsea CBS 118893]
MSSVKNILSFVALFAGVKTVYAGLESPGHNNVAIYWEFSESGKRNTSAAEIELLLRKQVIPLAFAISIKGPGGVPQINFSNQGDPCKPFPGTDLLHCPQIGEDIKTCQKKGKTILLSIGGATYSEGGFRSAEDAVAGANLLWDTFGPVKTTSNSSVLRPFDDAVVDGFDLDFEATVLNMVPFGKQLRTLYDAEKSKTFYLTAAPQCPYPDLYNKEMLEGGVKFDALFIQFYNNFCGLNNFALGSQSQDKFNFADWDNFAKKVSANPQVKIMIGAPANKGGASSGYVDAQTLVSIINWSKTFSSFGGVMMWDASQAWANGNFTSTVKNALSAGNSRVVRRSYAGYHSGY